MNNELKKIVSFPLLSKAGRAMKILLPKSPRSFTSRDRREPSHTITFEKVQAELKKITEEKVKNQKTPTKQKLSSFFKSISRSENVHPI